jgi:hypothetical protein
VKSFSELLKEESPFLNDAKSLTMTLLPSLSIPQLERYKKIKYYGDDVHLLQKKDKTSFILGKCLEFKFIQFVQVMVTLPRIGAPQNLKKALQVEMVNTTKEATDTGFASATYIEIAKHYPLISDFEQYQLSKKLWISVARSEEINVYVYDGLLKDYLREDGVVIRYNGSNIPENEIWGKDAKHIARVLVASIRRIK